MSKGEMYLEEIGKNSLSRLELVDKMLLEDIIIFEEAMDEKVIELNNNAQLIKGENSRYKTLQKSLKEYETVEEDLKKHKESQPDDINEAEKSQFEVADKNEKIRTAEKRFIKNVISKAESTVGEIIALNTDVTDFISLNSDSTKFINKDILQPIVEHVKNSFGVVKAGYDRGITSVNQGLEAIRELNEQLKAKHYIQQNEFVQLKQKFERHKEFYNQYNKLSKRVDEKNHLQKDLTEISDRIKKLKKARLKLIKDLNNIKREIFQKRFEKITQLNNEFNGSIKISLIYGGITDEYENALRNAFKGSNMRYNVIIPNIIQNFSPDKFAEIIHKEDIESLKKISGVDVERATAILTLFYESDAIYSIETIYCPDLPEFLLKIDAKLDTTDNSQDHYRRSSELSTGQRCTTVLPIVFAVSKNPLIIDQPEDNLDNKYISDTIRKIVKAQKKERQLVFITHNPNIPVLSDSENNIFLYYKEKKSTIDTQGDVDEVKNNILELLEGGEEAFAQRNELYNSKVSVNVASL